MLSIMARIEPFVEFAYDGAITYLQVVEDKEEYHPYFF